MNKKELLIKAYQLKNKGYSKEYAKEIIQKGFLDYLKPVIKGGGFLGYNKLDNIDYNIYYKKKDSLNAYLIRCVTMIQLYKVDFTFLDIVNNFGLLTEDNSYNELNKLMGTNYSNPVCMIMRAFNMRYESDSFINSSYSFYLNSELNVDNSFRLNSEISYKYDYSRPKTQGYGGEYNNTVLVSDKNSIMDEILELTKKYNDLVIFMRPDFMELNSHDYGQSLSYVNLTNPTYSVGNDANKRHFLLRHIKKYSDYIK